MAGRLANRKRKGYGKLNTHWRTGCSGKTSSTNRAALSAIRRAPQLGQKPRLCKVIEYAKYEKIQVFGMTAVTAHPQETVLQTAAFEVTLKFPLDIPRQCRALRRQIGHERRVEFFDDLVKEGTLRAMARVTKRAAARTGFPASWQRQHDRILASSC